jgi:DNA repair exonuclease SbcCD nuclease subunit
MPRFLHAADVHLDSPMKGLGRYENAPVEQMRHATRRAFENLVRLAIDERVDLVLLAGDLYDGDWKDYNTGLYLTKQLALLRDAKIPVLVISGNHDAHNTMTKSLRWPDNVTRLDIDRPQSVIFDDLGLAVHGQSYRNGAVTDDLASGYPDTVPGLFNIGLLHTGLEGLDGHARYAPCTVETLRQRQYHYWALGHIHKRQEPIRMDPLAVFPGNIQGRHVRETGEKGALIVETGRGRIVNTTFHRLDVVRWEVVTVEGREINSDDALWTEASRQFEGLRRLESDSNRLLAVRVEVRGECPHHDPLLADEEAITNELRSLATDVGDGRIWLERVVLNTKPLKPIAVPDGPIREMLCALDEMVADPSSLVPELSDIWSKVKASARAMDDGPRLDDPAWLSDLMAGVKPLLLDRLQHPGAQDERKADVRP